MVLGHRTEQMGRGLDGMVGRRKGLKATPGRSALMQQWGRSYPLTKGGKGQRDLRRREHHKFHLRGL